MSAQNNGGTAFPMQDQQAIHAYAQARVEFLSSVKRDSPMSTAERDAEYIQARAEAIGGMSLRDYFAAKAMNSIMDGSWPDFQICPRNGEDIAQCTARNAYEYADAMLEARK